MSVDTDNIVASRKQFQGDIPHEETFDMGSLGEGLKIISRETKELTKKLATELLEMREFSGERALNDDHVIFLTRQMESGNFRWEQTQIITCTLDGVVYRMNGQHTSWSRLNMPDNYRAPVYFIRYQAKSDHDMRQLYASIDRGKARTQSNVVISYLSGRCEFSQFNKKILRMLAQGLAFWHWEDQTIRGIHTGDDRAYLMLKDHYQVTTKVGNFINGYKTGDIKHIFRAAVVGAMYSTFDKAPEKSIEFWNSVITGENLSKDDPRMVLRNKLMTASIGSQTINTGHKQDMTSSEEMMRWCVYAWNAYRDDKAISSLKTQLDKPRSAVR
jgi:hypothetical protein